MRNQFPGIPGGREPEDDTLTSTLSTLDTRLRQDGVQWRDTSADPAQWFPSLSQRSAVPMAHEADHPTQTPTLTERRLALPAAPHAPRHAPHGPGRLGTVLAGGSALLVVALLAFVLHGLVLNRTGGGTTLSVATQPLTPATSWTTSTFTPPSFSSPLAAMHPEAAPSNPNIIYLVGNDGTGPALQRSDDGGKTWKKLSIPTKDIASDPNLATDYDGVQISPLDAHTLLLDIVANPTTLCPTAMSAVFTGKVGGSIDASPASGPHTCVVQYLSHDGGTTWTSPKVPDRGLVGSVSLVSPFSGPALVARGARLYADLDHFSGIGIGNGHLDTGVRLVASDDGGATWSYVDQDLVAHGQYITSYLPDDNDNGGWAYTTNTDTAQSGVVQLWRTDDGVSWHQAPSLGPSECSQNATCELAGATVVNGNTSLLYMLVTAVGPSRPGATASPPHFIMTADGGHSWQTIPSVGIPTHAYPLTSVASSTLSDGTLVATVGTVVEKQIANDGYEQLITNCALYAWHPDVSSWQRLTSVAPIPSLNSMWIVPRSAGGFTVWATGGDTNPNTPKSIVASAIVG